MVAALECIDVHKRLTAGVTGCSAAVRVLAGINLTVHPGELVVVVGGRGSGKTTLLLCAAGLMRVDSGVVERFGHAHRPFASADIAYVHGGAAIERLTLRAASVHEGASRLFLLDDLSEVRADFRQPVSRWIARRVSLGDAVIVATASGHAAAPATASWLIRDGVLHRMALDVAAHRRVAEGAALR